MSDDTKAPKTYILIACVRGVEVCRDLIAQVFTDVSTAIALTKTRAYIEDARKERPTLLPVSVKYREQYPTALWWDTKNYRYGDNDRLSVYYVLHAWPSEALAKEPSDVHMG